MTTAQFLLVVIIVGVTEVLGEKVFPNVPFLQNKVLLSGLVTLASGVIGLVVGRFAFTADTGISLFVAWLLANLAAQKLGELFPDKSTPAPPAPPTK